MHRTVRAQLAHEENSFFSICSWKSWLPLWLAFNLSAQSLNHSYLHQPGHSSIAPLPHFLWCYCGGLWRGPMGLASDSACVTFMTTWPQQTSCKDKGPTGLPVCRFSLVRKPTKTERRFDLLIATYLPEVLWCIHLVNSKSRLHVVKMHPAMTGKWLRSCQPRIS